MVSECLERPIIVIVGPTASGKTDLAIRIAKRIGAEIICADSRTVYKDMNVGTAKPSKRERELVPHHGLDLVSPNERFTAADFQRYATSKIREIHSRGKPVIIVGGTGLYIDSVIFDYQFGGDRGTQMRSELNDMTIEQLQNYCTESHIQLPKNVKNKRHLIRAIEQKGVNHKRKSDLSKNTIIVGISTDRSMLQKRIEVRLHNMFDQCVVEEATSLAEKYGWDNEAMTASIYRITHLIIDASITNQRALELAVQADMRLAKRQMTWFRRNPHIYWSDDIRDLEEKCIAFDRKFTVEH